MDEDLDDILMSFPAPTPKGPALEDILTSMPAETKNNINKENSTNEQKAVTHAKSLSGVNGTNGGGGARVGGLRKRQGATAAGGAAGSARRLPPSFNRATTTKHQGSRSKRKASKKGVGFFNSSSKAPKEQSSMWEFTYNASSSDSDQDLMVQQDLGKEKEPESVKIYPINCIKIKFPFTAYPSQIGMMNRVRYFYCLYNTFGQH